jgi:uncharacterized protein YabE (DUF348 family)/3D (Asp-Asp-Asp) domain-containing protein
VAQAARSARIRGRSKAGGQHNPPPDLSQRPRHFRGRHHAATIIAIVIVAVVAFRLFPSLDVTVLHEGEALRVTALFDPRDEAVGAASVGLEPGDRVLVAEGGRHASISIQQARSLSVEVDGATVPVRTQAATIGGALASAGISLRAGDRVYLDGQLTTERGPLNSISFASRTTPALYPASPTSGRSPARITVQRARPVTVTIDSLRLDISTSAATVDSVLREMGIIIREGDLVRPSLTTPVAAGMTIQLANARTVTVRLNGRDQTLYTLATTVEDVLRLLGIDVGPGEILEPARETPIANGMNILIGLSRTVDIDLEEPIPPGSVYESDPNLPVGTVRIIPGVEGLRSARYRITYDRGVETGRVRISTGTVLREATPTRRIVGAARPSGGARPSLSAPDFNGSYSYKISAIVTWYNASHGGKAPGDPLWGITFTGAKLDYGICAVDPNVIPLGTWMYIPEYGKCLAADIGGGVRGNHIDLGFPESAGSNPWGTRYDHDVYILD